MTATLFAEPTEKEYFFLQFCLEYKLQMKLYGMRREREIYCVYLLRQKEPYPGFDNLQMGSEHELKWLIL